MQSIHFQTHELVSRVMKSLSIEVVVGHVPGHLRNVWGRRGVESTLAAAVHSMQFAPGQFWLAQS